jgi:hypothetical protein
VIEEAVASSSVKHQLKPYQQAEADERASDDELVGESDVLNELTFDEDEEVGDSVAEAGWESGSVASASLPSRTRSTKHTKPRAHAQVPSPESDSDSDPNSDSNSESNEAIDLDRLNNDDSQIQDSDADDDVGRSSKKGASTFLPSLQIGFTRGDSDASDWSDAEKDINKVDTVRKNRRGQRARKAYV